MHNFICLQRIYLTLICVHVDSLESIKKYYQSSSYAEKETNETTLIINNSEKTRNDLLTNLDTLTSKGNLSREKLKQIKIPDIQILNEKVNIHYGVVKVFVVSTWYTDLFNCISLSYI